MSQLVRVYKDELLKSYIERLYKISPYLTLGVLFEEMFGERVLRIHPYVPSHIERIVTGLGGYFISEDLIKNHTLYEFYTAFQGQDVQQAIYREMLIGHGNAYKIVKYNEIAISQYYKYCPLCVKEQLEQHGDFSWNRMHQITPVCTKHGIWIQESTFPMKYRKDEYSRHRGQLDLKQMCISSSLENLSQAILEKAIKVSKLIELIIDDRHAKDLTLKELREAYYYKLQEKGYLYPSGESVRITEIIQQLEIYFTKELLDKIGIQVEKCVTKTLNRFCDIVHPLYHVIMLIFLDIDITTGVPILEGIIPDIPYYCLNPLNNHEDNHIIDDIKVHYCYITKQHMCTFYCTCGFVFTTRLDHIIESQGTKIGKIKKFGKVYEEQLIRLRHLGIKAIARKTGINHGTIRKQLRYYDRYGTIAEVKEEMVATKEAECITESNTLQAQENTDTTIEEIAVTVSIAEDYRKKEWEKKDHSYYTLIESEILKELEGGRKPIRITKTRLAKNIGAVHAVVYNIEKMTQTKALIEHYEETQEQYYRRKIMWAVKVIEERGEVAVEWRILKKVGCSDKNREVVKQLIREIL